MSLNWAYLRATMIGLCHYYFCIRDVLCFRSWKFRKKRKELNEKDDSEGSLGFEIHAMFLILRKLQPEIRYESISHRYFARIDMIIMQYKISKKSFQFVLK